MIKAVSKDDLAICAALIRESFQTVADEFGLTRENAPRHTAFATTEERLLYHFEQEHRPMYAYYEGEAIVGYYSLFLSEQECELNNLCVSPTYRHRGIGKALLAHAFRAVKDLGCTKIKIGIVEENTVLKQWYARLGFVHTGTEKFDFFPFTCGYMEKILP